LIVEVRSLAARVDRIFEVNAGMRARDWCVLGDLNASGNIYLGDQGSPFQSLFNVLFRVFFHGAACN
jgi:hypothetical protein